MVNPGIHAEMTILIRREKELEEELKQLEAEELPLWSKRIALAEEKGMPDLADQARERLRELQAQVAKNRAEIDSIDMQKSMLRHESRRPSGNEVARAEHLVEQVRLAGLVDPDRKDWDDLESQSLSEDSGAILDFSSED